MPYFVFYREVLIMKKSSKLRIVKIFHYLWFSLVSASLSSFITFFSLILLYQVFICKIHIFSQQFQFWNMFQIRISTKESYKTNISGIKLKFLKLYKLELKGQKLRTKDLKKSRKDFKKVLYYQSLFYISKIIKTKVISWYYNNLLVSCFRIDKTWEFIA